MGHNLRGRLADVSRVAMQLSRVDLNLFTVFTAIYHEGGITPASRRLHLSQPAVSHALARLRELLDDPLFERRGNDMVPTDLARSLAPVIDDSLGVLDVMLRRAGRFDPATSRHHFTLAVRASQELLFLPRLVARLAKDAPGVDVATVRIDRNDLEEELSTGEIDLAMDVALPLPVDIRRECIAEESMVVLARAAHPEVQGSLTLETYMAQQHVLVTGRRHGVGHEDMALGRLGKSRRIRVRCQQHSVASEIVARTDLLATMPRSQAQRANRHVNNQVLDVPAETAPIETFLYWHAKSDENPAARWFRELVRQALA